LLQVVECNIKLTITIPKGSLYYPCCWNDTLEPIKIFLNQVDEFHFVDNMNIGLPALEGEEVRSRYPYTSILNHGKFCDPREGKLLHKPQWFVEKSSMHPVEIKQETQDFANTLTDCAWAPKNPGLYQETWCNSRNGTKTEVYCHHNDGVIALSSFDKLSVFFYRGDSIGESGSGQWWLGPKLFNVVLDKLLDGGLIITDGSNPDPMFGKVEWSPLWKERNYSFARSSSVSSDERSLSLNENNDFIYRDRTFKCLGKIAPIRNRTTYVWQVKHL